MSSPLQKNTEKKNRVCRHASKNTGLACFKCNIIRPPLEPPVCSYGQLSKVAPKGIPSLEEVLNNDDDSVSVACYASGVVAYVRHLEECRSLSVNFLGEPNAPVSRSMRSVLIDWLIQVQHYLVLCQETLYLTVSIVDHYFDARVPIAMDILQLIVVASLFIACKLEERFQPSIKKLLHLTEEAYKDQDLLAMERQILRAIDFNGYFASPVIFVHICLQAARADVFKLKVLSFYLIDVILHDLSSARTPASLMGAAAAYLACKILKPEQDGRQIWDRTVQWHSGYSEDELRPVVTLMVQTLVELPTSNFQGAFKKYSSVSRYQTIAKMEELHPAAIKSLRLPWSSSCEVKPTFRKKLQGKSQ